MDNFVIGNMAFNGGLVALAAYFYKRLTDKTDKDNQDKHNDLKERIQSNREFYTDSFKDLKEDIKTVADLQRIANGRTGKLEMNVHDLNTSVRAQVNLCKERNEKDACNGHK